MKNLIKWFAGFFQDQGKQSSSKRAIVYLFVYFFFMQVKASIEGRTTVQEVLYATVIVILFGIGAITSEFISANWPKKE